MMQSRNNGLVMMVVVTVVGDFCQAASVAAFQNSRLPPPPTARSTATKRRNRACISQNQFLTARKGMILYEQKKPNSNDDEKDSSLVTTLLTNNPTRALSFSGIMALCGAILGPFLDSYHSAFGVLAYDEPFTAALWQQSPPNPPALTTVWWVPILFGVAGWLIGWLYIVLDAFFLDTTTMDANTAKNILPEQQQPSPPKILVGISMFTFQYWLSAVLVATEVVDRTGILNLMSVYAAVAFLLLDGSMAGFLTSCATALGGPLIEIGLLSLSRAHLMPPGGGYHYNDLGETGFFPLWILPVYFLGGPAVGMSSSAVCIILSRSVNYVLARDF